MSASLHSLSPSALEGLRKLWKQSKPPTHIGDHDPFPGAIGRAGTALVRKGLAAHLGRKTFGSARNELPFSFVVFELTEKGRRFCAETFEPTKAGKESGR